MEWPICQLNQCVKVGFGGSPILQLRYIFVFTFLGLSDKKENNRILQKNISSVWRKVLSSMLSKEGEHLLFKCNNVILNFSKQPNGGRGITITIQLFYFNNDKANQIWIHFLLIWKQQLILFNHLGSLLCFTNNNGINIVSSNSSKCRWYGSRRPIRSVYKNIFKMYACCCMYCVFELSSSK